MVKSFGVNNSDLIAKELKDLGLKDHESLYDPIENKKIPGVLAGKQYIYKLEHQASKKLSARGGGPAGLAYGETYTTDMQPGRGGGVSGRAIGSMELYGLLAHGSTKNLHEMYSYKSNFDPEIWRAIESGDVLPNPEPGHSQQRFVAMLRGMGVHVDVDNNRAKMIPFLDRQLKDVSQGALTNHKTIRGKDLKEEKGGIFDPDKTGGVQGDRWSHIKLPEPVPNPTFEKAILSILHMKKSDFLAIVRGEKEVEGQTGGNAIVTQLNKVDVKARLAKAQEQAKKAKGSSLNSLHREIRYLKTLSDNKIKPGEYVIKNVPVIPPKFRPIYPLPDGNLRVSDVNQHYQALLQIREEMENKKGKPEFKESYNDMRTSLYSAVGGVMGLDQGIVKRKDFKGLATEIGGAGSPKSGYFHSSLLKKRQDVSATAVATVNPKMGLDEIGVPEQLAWKTFRPFLVKELRSMGMTPLQAKDAISKRTPSAKEALINVVRDKHVIINRAPTLHKFSILALKPKLVSGYALQTNPFIVNGLNLDYDGDTLAVHVPISAEANAEAAKMLPSKHLYKPGTGALQPKLGQEYVLGLFRISVPGQKAIAKRFSSTGEVLALVKNRKIDPSTSISIIGIGPTTPGRVLINSVIPAKHRDYKLIWTSKVIQQKLVDIDKESGRDAFTKALQNLANIGRRWAYLSGSSFLLSDLQTMNKQRNEAYRRADIMAERVRMGSGDEDEKKKKIVDIYRRVSNRLTSSIKMKANDAGVNNNIMDMTVSGARGGQDQVRQLVSNVGVMLDHENTPMTMPVKGTYTEGLDSAEYFQHLYGARKGMIDKSQSVKDPGAITKQMAVSATGFRVTTTDCGTKSGIMESTAANDAIDRYLAEKVVGVGSKNALVTSSTLNAARAKGIKKLKVRSPITCEASSGVCARCFGLDEEGKSPAVGDFIGIKEMHGITEPTTQLAMRQFHTGGVMSTGGSGVSSFDRAKQLFTMPENIGNKAILSELAGRVTDVKANPVGGWFVTVGAKKHKVSRHRKPIVKAGDSVEKGQELTDGHAQPQDILRLRGLRAMQIQLRNDIKDVYSGGGVNIKAKTIETPVKMLTNGVRISDPGDFPGLVPGDYARHSQVESWNKSNPAMKPAQYVHILPGSEQMPHKSDDWVQRMSHNRIKQVLQEAPAMGAESKMTGGTPIAPLIFGKHIDPATRGLTSG
jgi:DNA-directed RNA polymerase subunit beta'